MAPELFSCKINVCGKEAELSRSCGSGTCLSRDPYFSSGWGKQTLPGMLHFSESPDPAGEEAHMEGNVPILPTVFCADSSELILLTVAFSYPEQQCGSAEPPAHAIPPVGGIPFPTCPEPCSHISSGESQHACRSNNLPSASATALQNTAFSWAVTCQASQVLWELWGCESHGRAAKPCPWGSAPTARRSLHQLWGCSDRQTPLRAPTLLSSPGRGFIPLSILPQKNSKLCTLSCLCQAPGVEPREL